MGNHCKIYIDESGDLGIQKGTRWFVLTGVVVDDEDETAIREILKSIRLKLNLNNIHFRKLHNFEQKMYVANEVSKGKFEYANVIIDTSKITLKLANNVQKLSFVIYNYASRYLIERLSWLLRDTDRYGDIVLSSRGTPRDKELIDYIETKLLPYKDNSIENRFLKITSKQASSWDMLQLADICATSMLYQYEENGYGFVEPCFNYRLGKHLYTRNGKVMTYGLKYYTNDMRPDESYFTDRMICK